MTAYCDIGMDSDYGRPDEDIPPKEPQLVSICLECGVIYDDSEESEEASPEPERCSRCYMRSLGG